MGFGSIRRASKLDLGSLRRVKPLTDRAVNLGYEDAGEHDVDLPATPPY